MIAFTLPAGERIVLPLGTEVDIDLLEAATTEVLEESYSLPIGIPIIGNERALAFVYRVDLSVRALVVENVVLEYDGLPLHTGNLTFIKADDKTVSATFSVDGFLGTIKDKRLRECDFGAPRTYTDMVAHAVDVNTGTWPAQQYCFPPMFNKDFYGSENPAWYPSSAQPFAVGASYSVNDLATSLEGGIVQREGIYRANGVGWDLTAFGICNHWDHVNGTFYTNTVDGQNYYNLVPCLYLKYMVEVAAAAAGLTAAGEWFSDPRHDRAAMAGNRALDGSSRENYFNVGRLTDYTVLPSSDWDAWGYTPLPCTDEATGQFEDTNGLHDNTNFRFTPSAEGVWWFFITIKVNVPNWVADIPSRYIRLAADLDTQLGMPWADVTHTYGPGYTILSGWKTHDFELADVGQEFVFPGGWPPGTIIHECQLIGFLNTDPDITALSVELRPEDSAPNISVGELIQHVRDAFCLRVTVNRAAGTLNFDYRKSRLDRTPVNMTTRRTGPVTIDFGSRNKGFHFTFEGGDNTLTDLSKLSLIQTVDSEFDLVLPTGPRVYAVARYNRQVYLPIKSNDSIYLAMGPWTWFPSGTLPSSATVGDQTDATAINCAIRPPDMDIISMDDEDFLMPMIHQAGNSPYYNTADNDPGLYLFYFMGVIDNGNGAMCPVATPYKYNQDGTVIGGPEYDWVGDDGLFENEWGPWAKALHGAEPVRTNMRFNPADLASGAWEDLYMMDNQVYLPVRLPVRYGKGSLVADGCELLLLKPPEA